jgi:hypothetical protein
MLNLQDIIRKQNITLDFEIIYLIESRMRDWEKTWNKKFISINENQLLNLVSKNKIFSFYCTDTDPVLLWIGLNSTEDFLISQNKCFIIDKINFLKFIDELKLINKKFVWPQEGF